MGTSGRATGARRAVVAVMFVALVAGGAVLDGAVAERLGSVARAAGEETLSTARSLVEEARPFFQESGNPDLSRGDRKKARREAYRRLKEARRLYDLYLDANPSRIEPLDAEYCDCNALMYWCRKMATPGEFDNLDEPELPDVGGDDAGGDDEDTGGIGGVEPRVDPEPEPEPDGEIDEGPESEPEPEDPAVVFARRARETFEALERRLADRPGDVATMYELYEQFLAEFDDTSLPEYTQAALRLGELSDRMKTVYKEELEEDPDDLADIDSKTVEKAVSKLQREMKSSDVEVRRSAARVLGGLRTGAASFALVKALDDEDDEVRKLAFDGLVATGGRRVGYNVTKVYRNSRVQESRRQAVDLLAAIAAKGRVDAKVAAPFLGRFVLAQDDEIVDHALAQLQGLGRAAGPGLVEALETRNYLKRILVIQTLAEVRYYPGATQIGLQMRPGDRKDTVEIRTAAIAALKQMGACAVPHLIPLLRGGKQKAWTAFVIREITGQPFGMKDAKEIREWCEHHAKPSDCE